jgi:hypothetical protein
MHIRHVVRSMMGRTIVGMVVIIVGIAGGLAGETAGVSAAPPKQQPVIVGAELPVMGPLNDATPQATYVFDCYQDGVESVYVETTDGDLMVEIAVFDPGGQRLASGQVEQKKPNISVMGGVRSS